MELSEKKKKQFEYLNRAKQEHAERLAAMKGQDEVDHLKNWQALGFPQPAPPIIQQIKNDTGMSWSKFVKFVENM
jgi:hypothetical protein